MDIFKISTTQNMEIILLGVLFFAMERITWKV